MASYTWNAADGGDWNTAADWTPTGIPTATDTASFATGGNAYSVTGDAAAASIAVDADFVTFDGALTLGTVPGTAGLTGTDNAYVLLGATAFVNDAGTVDFAAGTLLEVDGTFIADGGTADVALVTGPDADWTNAAALTLNQLYVTAGATYAGDVTLNDGGTVNIDTSATFGGGTLTLAGSGTVYVANAAGAATGGYGLSEAITVGAGAVLFLASDPGVTASVSGGIAGAGSVAITGGNVVLAAANTYTGGTNVDNATLTLVGANAAGPGAIFLQDGALAATADSTGAAGAETVVGAGGNDTVSAASGSLLVFGSDAATLTFQGGADAATVVGGSGTLLATGGAGGDTIFGGTGGQDLLSTGTGPTTLVSNAGGTLNAMGGAANVLVAAGGNTTLSGGASTGNNTFFASGTGTTVVESGSGMSTVVAGSALNLIFGAAGSQDVYLSGGISQLDFLQGAEGGTNNVVGFNATDTIQLTNYQSGEAQSALASEVITGGNTVLTLSDNTHIVLFGFTGVTSATFT